ncbi:hypothetical protein IWW55_000077 [Coemansia sp. RSA 2706]|nr:hypothetical protein IWW55_000077 [Coemansia sp. RSA 2706]
MAKFSDLHDDIVGYILEELTEDVVEDAELWSSSLYLLAICRQWRALARPIVYSTGFIGKYDEEDSSEPAPIFSNMELVHITASAGYIKSLAIVHGDSCSAWNMLSKIVDTLLYFREPLPNVKTVSVHSSISDYLSSDYTLAEAETAAVEDAVNVFTRHIPGTTQLSIVCDRVHLAVHRFITALFYAYESSLDAFIYNGVPFEGDTRCIFQLHSLFLKFTAPALQPIQIDPKMLTTLSLNSFGLNALWNSFSAASSSNSANVEQPDGLPALHNDLGALSLSEQAVKQSAASLFPNLTWLILDSPNDNLTVLKHLVRPPLRRLEMMWTLVDMRNSDITLGFLKKFVIYYSIRTFDNSQIDILPLFAKINALLARAAKVPFVRLMLTGATELLPWHEARWPCLTCLELYGLNTTIDFVFKLLLMLCELKQLKINSLQMPNNEQRTSHNYLRNLRDSLGQPSSAKLEWFTLITRPSFDVDYLDATTKLLKWYLPQLKYVLIPSE